MESKKVARWFLGFLVLSTILVFVPLSLYRSTVETTYESLSPQEKNDEVLKLLQDTADREQMFNSFQITYDIQDSDNLILGIDAKNMPGAYFKKGIVTSRNSDVSLFNGLVITAFLISLVGIISIHVIGGDTLNDMELFRRIGMFFYLWIMGFALSYYGKTMDITTEQYKEVVTELSKDNNAVATIVDHKLFFVYSEETSVHQGYALDNKEIKEAMHKAHSKQVKRITIGSTTFNITGSSSDEDTTYLYLN